MGIQGLIQLGRDSAAGTLFKRCFPVLPVCDDPAKFPVGFTQVDFVSGLCPLFFMSFEKETSDPYCAFYI